MFSGAIVAIVTPFKDGMVDEKAYRELINFVITGGVSGIVPCGTTGESATLSHKEHKHVIDITVDEVGKRVPVIAGTGSNSTTEAIRLTKHAKEAGADACPAHHSLLQQAHPDRGLLNITRRLHLHVTFPSSSTTYLEGPG